MGVPLMDDNTFAWFWIALMLIFAAVGTVVFVCSL